MRTSVKATALAAVMLHAGVATCAETPARPGLDPFWKNAVVYFLMTDRFANGDPTNDHAFDRRDDGATLRSFMGGDINGITQKIEEGYFDALGVNAIWMTPLVEQIHGAWQDDIGKSYAFHGYWPKDWTKVDPNYGTEADMANMIKAAHRHGVHVLADVVINHTGPMTAGDVAWPAEWVRMRPMCQWTDYANNVHCALAPSLTDVRTETEANVPLPPFLIEKWRAEGRLETELAELDAFFGRTNLPRAPKYYIVKWLTDWVREYGLDGFRVDTAKHVEAEVWKVVKDEAVFALRDWKARNPDLKLDDREFFMVGEVFEYGVNGFRYAVPGGRAYDYGDRKVDFYEQGFDSLINMGFATHASSAMEQIFSTYSDQLNGGPLEGVGILNYVVSHDDPNPYDKAREHPYDTALKLMLAPGAAQIYYGDELARSLVIQGAVGDATLRSFMNWDDLKDTKTQALFRHWQKLGIFRKAHLSVGAGVHRMRNDTPYIFSRELDGPGVQDRVLVGIGMPVGQKSLSTHGLFANGIALKDYYSGQSVTVKNGRVDIVSDFSIVLLGKPD